MKREKSNYGFYLFILVIAGIVLPLVLFYILNTPDIKQPLIEKYYLRPFDIFGALSDWLSVVFATFLGLIVYNQSQKINDLESSKFDLYIGVIGIGELKSNTFSAESHIAANNCFEIFEGFSDKLVADTFILSMGAPATQRQAFENNREEVAPSLVNNGFSQPRVNKPIALLFATKNQPLIISIRFSEIEVFFNEMQVLKKKGTDRPLQRIFEDDSRFTVVIDLPVSPSPDVKDIKINLSLSARDQLLREHKMEVMTRLGIINNSYYLYSCESKTVTVTK